MKSGYNVIMKMLTKLELEDNKILMIIKHNKMLSVHLDHNQMKIVELQLKIWNHSNKNIKNIKKNINNIQMIYINNNYMNN